MAKKFLSIQAQDFIEDGGRGVEARPDMTFLSIQAQDFIEDTTGPASKSSSGNS